MAKIIRLKSPLGSTVTISETDLDLYPGYTPIETESKPKPKKEKSKK